MKTHTLLAALLCAGASVNAQQYPCSTFENPNPQGNWYTEYCTATYNNTSSSDGSQCVKLGDDAGASWFKNKTDYKWLGERFLHKCLCFDYFLVNDGDPDASNIIYPYIAVSDGVNTIYFQSSTPVTEGSGWIHICAPIELCTGSTPPSNADGSWTMGSTTNCSDFNSVLYNSSWIGFFTDFTSFQTEEMWIDNVCIRDCETQDPPCTANFDLDIKFGLLTPNAQVNVLLAAWYVNSTYVVDWGDGSPLGTPGTPHTYAMAGTYAVCVTEYVNDRFVCKNCIDFCYGLPYSGIPRPGKDAGANTNEGIGKGTILAGDKNFMDAGFPIFPNPSRDFATLQLPNSPDAATIKVFDMLGNVVSETIVKAGESNRNVKLNTGRLADGIYTVEVTVGGRVSTQKISVAK